MESPLQDEIEDYSVYDRFFNWTMTYRADSDIYRPYGWLAEKNSGELYPPTRISWPPPPPTQVTQTPRQAHNKTRQVAWLVSNCETHSRREEYVRIMRQFIKVDVFGGCGELECGKEEDHNTRECNNMLEENYKFYLSFENSLCSDYVTEKFYRTLSLDIIPVVMGGGDYNNIAPPKSFIDVADFESPEELAKFLLKLDKDDQEYLSYFWWKVSVCVT